MKNNLIIGGLDEVGRGSLFGPIVAAIVVIEEEKLSTLKAKGIKDSKKLSPEKREALVPFIKTIALDYAYGQCSALEIDQIGINKANRLAMERALQDIVLRPEKIYIDGKVIIDSTIEQESIIDGDNSNPAIAAASIIAKVCRDNLIMDLAQTFNEYDLINNKGYGTKKHMEALKEYGPSFLHRKTFLKGISNE